MHTEKKESLFLFLVWLLILRTRVKANISSYWLSLETIFETMSLKYQKILRYQHTFQYQWTMLWQGFKVRPGTIYQNENYMDSWPSKLIARDIQNPMGLFIKIHQIDRQIIYIIYIYIWCNPLMGKDWKQSKHPLSEDLWNNYDSTIQWIHLAIKRIEVATCAGEKFSEIY